MLRKHSRIRSSITSPCSTPALGLLALAMSALSMGASCENRTVKIDRDQLINTGVDPGGYPVAVDVVSVFAGDLDLEVNKDLRPDRPDAPITADVWFNSKPTKDSMKDKEDNKRFRLSKEQIHSYTDEAEETFWGKKIGGKIVGGAAQGGNLIIESGIPVKDIYSKGSAIYVFAKFTDAQGKVLKTKPAVFWRVADFDKTLAVQVKAQSIERTTRRKGGQPLPWEEGAVAESERRSK